MEKSSGNGRGGRREFVRGCKCKLGEGAARKCASRSCVEEECERFVGKRLDKGRADWPDIPIRAEISDPINSVLLPSPPHSLPFVFSSPSPSVPFAALYRFFPAVQLSKRNHLLFFFFFFLLFTRFRLRLGYRWSSASPLSVSLVKRAKEISFQIA